MQVIAKWRSTLCSDSITEYFWYTSPILSPLFRGYTKKITFVDVAGVNKLSFVNRCTTRGNNLPLINPRATRGR